jgi:hypothetical protein
MADKHFVSSTSCFSFKLFFPVPSIGSLMLTFPRSCACKIISRIERPQAPMLSGNQRSAARHSLPQPLIYSDNLPNSNLQTLFSVHLVIPPQIVQTRGRVTRSAGWGKIQHNQRGGSVLSTKPPNNLQRMVLVPLASLNHNHNSSGVLVCSGALVRLDLQTSHQVDSVSFVFLLVRIT